MSLLLDPAEIEALAAGLTQPQRQVEELRHQGFWRARLSRAHTVILERAHYEAVCAGAAPPAVNQANTGDGPKLRSVK